MHFPRYLKLPARPQQSFFLWGPRLVGKSLLLRETYPTAAYLDLLRSDEFMRFSERPAALREFISQQHPSLVVIDEVQKVPMLLDEVHWLIENQGTVFVLCGSSARKVRRGHANLLGGRALRYELHGLTAKELGDSFDLTRYLNVGNLPLHFLSDNPLAALDAYVGDYLQQEIAAEALVRNLSPFIDFLRAAAIADTETVDYKKIGSECAVTSATAKNYYDILVDTLLGFFLPAYVRREKRRVIHSPKFYFSNVGVVNHLARRRQMEPRSELFGKAFENWLVNELRACNAYCANRWDLSFWRLSSGGEVDLLINDSEFALEFKSSMRITNQHLKGLRLHKDEFPKVKRRILVCLESLPRKTEDGIEIIPVAQFIEMLWEEGL